MRKPVAALIFMTLSLALSSTTAYGQQGSTTDASVEARERYERGMQLYEEGDLEAAFIEFQRAYELRPSYKIQYNIALVLKQKQDYAGAAKAYRLYLDGAANLDQTRKAEVEGELRALEARLGRISISVDVAGAEILIDDFPVAKSPLESPLVVNAGRRRITVIKDGFMPTTKIVLVAGRDSLELNFKLTPGRGSSKDRPRLSEASRPRSKEQSKAAANESSFPWLAWTTTGVLALGATATGLLTLKAEDDLTKKRATPEIARASLNDASDKTKNLALATDILIGVSVAAGALSLYLTLDSSPSQEASSVSTPRVGIGPGSVMLSGGF